MNKKLYISVMIAFILCISVVFGVIAGTTRDTGTLALTPPPGEVNWTAWMNVVEWIGGIPYVVHPPQIIMTEDSYLYREGIGLGYTDQGWQIQVENFKVSSNYVNMLFCGLDNSAGKNWAYSFEWDKSVSTTVHETPVPLRETTNFQAPRLTAVDVVGETKVISFSGQPGTTYQVYRSMSPATEDYDRSNGRYSHQGEATTDSVGFGQFTDSTAEAALDYGWYTIVYFAPTATGPHGCHSILADPTNVRVFDFSAEYISETHTVELAWQTASELDIRGFNVLRATSSTGERVKLNDTLIDAGPPGTLEGYSYDFTDDDLGDAAAYYYWVEIVEFEGRQERVGPQMVVIINNGEPYTYYLPLILK